MADLVTRLRLDNRQFDENIRRSRQQIESISNSASIGQKGLDTLLSGFKGVAAGIVSVNAAMALFDTAINSNSTLQNAWNDNIKGMKSGVEDFFTALTTGDWSIFEGGLNRAIEKGKRFQQLARDISLGLKMTTAYLDEGDAKFKASETKITDSKTSKKEKEAEFIIAKNQYEQNKKDANTLKNGFNNTLNGLLKGANINADKLNTDELYQTLLLGANPFNEEYNKKLDEYSKLWSWQNEAFSKDKRIELYKHRAGDDTFSGQKRWEEYVKKIKGSKEYKRFQELYNGDNGLEIVRQFKLLPTEGEGLKNQMAIVDVVGEMAGLKERMKTQETDFQGLAEKFDKNGKWKTEGGKPNSKDKIKPKDLYDFQMDNWVNEELHGFHSKLKRAAYGLEPLPITYKPEIIEEEDPEDLPLPIPKVDNTTVDSLNGVAQILGVITNLTNEGASAWLSWVSTILTSCAAVIPAIKAITAAKKEEAVANGVASATQTPVVGWLMAGAAVASVIAALAAIPSFSNGGIFQSNLTSGDKNLARINGGEMILNKGQQYNLFKLLDGGGSLGNSGNVTFKIQGKELVGVLNNYNNKMRKVL